MYSYSFDEENYSGRFETLEEALSEAADNADGRDTCWIGKAVEPDPLEFVNADYLLEHIREQDEFCHDWGEHWPRMTEVQEHELTKMLRAAVRKWMDKHNLHPDFWCVESAEKYNLAQMDAAQV